MRDGEERNDEDGRTTCAVRVEEYMDKKQEPPALPVR